jgi:hypothetical protein
MRRAVQPYLKAIFSSSAIRGGYYPVVRSESGREK